LEDNEGAIFKQAAENNEMDILEHLEAKEAEADVPKTYAN
jgi:hypothetical protein